MGEAERMRFWIPSILDFKETEDLGRGTEVTIE